MRARDDQWPPLSASDGMPWTAWLVMGGRGAGKTRTGAEWVRGVALGLPGFAHAPVERIALIGETAADVRDVMIEGVSGLLAIHARDERPLWESSRRRLRWPNGALAHVFSAEDPDQLRGPQFECAWLDELAKWRYAEEAYDMLQFGLRLGHHPRQIITTTPRPTQVIKRLMSDQRTVITRAGTDANRDHLSKAFFDQIVGRYRGTKLGRQEIDGDLIEECEDALWSREQIEQARVPTAPHLHEIVVAIDPPTTAHKRSDKCGIVAVGRDSEETCYVLADETVSAARPHIWAHVAIALYHRLEADRLVVEVNQGGDMVSAVIMQADKHVPVTQVRATRSKFLRATPVAQLYEQGRVHHVGSFAALEDEMCTFGPKDRGRASPDRLDALVWAITHLVLKPQSKPHMRWL
jgi:phage terminase large subunit-like protein